MLGTINFIAIIGHNKDYCELRIQPLKKILKSWKMVSTYSTNGTADDSSQSKSLPITPMYRSLFSESDIMVLVQSKTTNTS